MDAFEKLKSTIPLISDRESRELLIKGYLTEHSNNGHDPAEVWELIDYQPEMILPDDNALNLAEYDAKDTGNAQRMARMYGDKIRFVYEKNKCSIYNGKFWQLDDGGDKTLALTKNVAKSYLVDASKAEEKKEIDALIKHAKESLTMSRRQAMIELLKAEPGITVSVNDFDTDLYFLNVKNGTVDLRTGELKPHDKADMITRYIDIEYNPDTYSELWFKFLQITFEANEPLMQYVQLAIGLSATGDMSHMVTFLPYGNGWNGKSTLLNTCEKVLGEYATEIDAIAFTDNGKEGGPNEAIASLYKKRLVTSTEVKPNKDMATDTIKRATGGELLSHNRKYEHEFKFTPVFKLWLSGNHMLRIKDSTDSIWLRLKQIPFNVKFRPDTPGFNPTLKTELLTPENKQGVLTWIVDGAVKLYKSGKPLSAFEPEIIRAATQNYRDDQDVILDWWLECFQPDPEAEAEAATFWNSYKTYCETNDKFRLGKQNFYEKLAEKGLKKWRGTGNKLFFTGGKLASKTP